MAINTIAANDQVYLQFCFDSQQQANIASKKISFLKIESDYIGQDNHCLDVTTTSKREPLYQKVMKIKFGITSTTQLQSVSNNQCHFKITSIKKKYLTTGQYAVKENGIHANHSNSENQSKSISTLAVIEGKSASLKVQGQDLELKCRITNSGYNIDIKIAGINNSLTTSRFITKGSSIELGSIAKSLNTNNQQKNVNTGLGISNKNINQTENIYLSIK